MLPRSQKIQRKDFPLVKSKGKYFGNELFSAYVYNGTGGKKFAFSVSKKVSKKAVDRNRIRRFGYRAIKDVLAETLPGTTAIFFFKKIPKSEQDVKTQIKSILVQSKSTK